MDTSAREEKPCHLKRKKKGRKRRGRKRRSRALALHEAEG